MNRTTLAVAAIGLGALLPALCACTHVEVVGDAAVRRESALKVSISPGPSGRLLVSRLTGLGVIPRDSGITLGFLRETLVMAGDPGRCQVVVLAEHERQAQNIQAMLREQGYSLTDLCVGSLGGNP